MPKIKAPKLQDHFPEIQNFYGDYQEFYHAKKAVSVERMDLKRVAAKKAYLCRADLLHSVSAAVESAFEAEIADISSVKYAFRVFVPRFGKAPCIRFDSGFHSHLNPESGDGLPAREVPAPHVHRVDPDGWLRAYHTPELSDPVAAAAISNDHTLGTKYFCREINLVSQTGGDLSLQQIRESFDLSVPDSGAMDAALFPP